MPSARRAPATQDLRASLEAELTEARAEDTRGRDAQENADVQKYAHFEKLVQSGAVQS